MRKHFFKIKFKDIIYFNFLTVFIFQFFFLISHAHSEYLSSWDNMDLENSYIIFKKRDSYYFFLNDGLSLYKPKDNIYKKKISLKFFSTKKNEINNLNFCDNEKGSLKLIKEINIQKTNELVAIEIDVPKSSCVKVKITPNDNLKSLQNIIETNTFLSKRISCSVLAFQDKKINYLLRREKYLNCIENI